MKTFFYKVYTSTDLFVGEGTYTFDIDVDYISEGCARTIFDHAFVTLPLKLSQQYRLMLYSDPTRTDCIFTHYAKRTIKPSGPSFSFIVLKKHIQTGVKVVGENSVVFAVENIPCLKSNGYKVGEFLDGWLMYSFDNVGTLFNIFVKEGDYILDCESFVRILHKDVQEAYLYINHEVQE